MSGAPTAIIRSKASKTTENREAYMNVKEVYVNTLQPYRPNGHSPLLNRSTHIVIKLRSKNPSEIENSNSIKEKNDDLVVTNNAVWLFSSKIRQ